MRLCRLGFVTDSLGNLPLREMLKQAERLGVSGLEINTGGWSTAPHFDLAQMLASADDRKALKRSFQEHSLEIISLNANGNPLHPTQPEQGQCLRDTIRVAGELGVKTVCTMSGLPEGRAGDRMPNWVVASWPPETQAMLRYQWEERLLPFWSEIADLAKENGVERIALELHGNQCVYNVRSLLKLRNAIGPVIGANLDPSHLFWMGADPLHGRFGRQRPIDRRNDGGAVQRSPIGPLGSPPYHSFPRRSVFSWRVGLCAGAHPQRHGGRPLHVGVSGGRRIGRRAGVSGGDGPIQHPRSHHHSQRVDDRHWAVPGLHHQRHTGQFV